MHPGPMNRGVEIDSLIADGAQSLTPAEFDVLMKQVRLIAQAVDRTVVGDKP